MIAVRYRLGIDFGTSNTVAVIHEDDGRTRPVLFDGFPLLPSCVCVATDSATGSTAGTDGLRLLVGREATHAARVRPELFEPHPKRRIDDGTVLLGAAEVPVARLIAAVLAQVRAETVRTMGGEPATVVLTYPAAWGPRRRSVLLDAARLAGLGTPQLVPEPVAAAAFFVVATGAAVPVGSRVVVYDFGAGTFDASVVTRTATGWEVIASEGLDDAGGLDVDTAIVDYLGTVHAAHPELLRRLTSPQTVADRRANRNLWEDVRTAKEILSRSASTYIHVPLIEQDAPLGREQLERLARPVVDRTVALTRRVFGSADPARPLAGLFLVGGSSRMPLVATLLHQATGVAPTVLEQPELVVAEGSARPLATTGAQPVADAAGVRPLADTPLWPTAAPPIPGAPVSPAAAPAGQDRSMRGVAAVRPTQNPAQIPAQIPAQGAVRPPALPADPAPGLPGGVPGFSIPPVSGRQAAGPPQPGAGWAASGLPTSSPPVSGPPMSGPPASGPPASGPPMSSPPMSGRPMSGRPMSGPPMAGRPVSGQPMSGAGSSWPDAGPSWPVSPAASDPASPVSPAAGLPPTTPAAHPDHAAVTAFGAGAPPATGTPARATAPPGAVRRTLVAGGICLGALLLFGLLGYQANEGDWALPFEFSSWNAWIGDARACLYPGFLLWLAYLFAAPASRTVPRTVTYALLLIPVMVVMSMVMVVVGWATGTTGMFVLLVIGLIGTVIVLAARRQLDGTEVRPVFGRADAGGLLLGVTVAFLAAGPEFQSLIEALADDDTTLGEALAIDEVPALHWFVFGPTATFAFAGLGAATGRLVALTAPRLTRWLPRIAAAVLALGSFAAVSSIGADLFGW